MAVTNNLGITLVEQAQAQKEVTVNEAITILDSALGGGVIDKDLNTPPGSPVEGNRYIVAASPTGAWSGKAKNIAFYFNGGWRFIAPVEGLQAWVNDEDTLYFYDGSNWIPATSVISVGSSTELTIASGAITITRSSHRIDTEADTSTDDLHIINGGKEGDIIYLTPENTARTIIFKNGTGNLRLIGSDFIADNSDDLLVLLKKGSNWLEISRSNNGA